MGRAGQRWRQPGAGIAPRGIELGLDEEDAAGQVGAGQVGAAQVGTGEVGAAQVGAAQVGGDQAGTAEAGAAQVGTAQAGPGQVGARVVGARLRAGPASSLARRSSALTWCRRPATASSARSAAVPPVSRSVSPNARRSSP